MHLSENKYSFEKCTCRVNLLIDGGFGLPHSPVEPGMPPLNVVVCAASPDVTLSVVTRREFSENLAAYVNVSVLWYSVIVAV